jgi:type II protein arginine methyltransferase
MQRNALGEALELYRKGRRDLAAQILQSILASDPENGGANHLLGLIAFQQGEHARARDLMLRATGCADATPEMFNNLGTILNALGEVEAAGQAYERALALKPDFVDSLNNLGVLYRNGLHIDKAIQLLRRAVQIDPTHAHARANLRAAYCDVVPGWHFSMLEDKARNNAYEAAINRAAPGKKVLDIGAGAGLLTLMAARAGATRVTGCEYISVIAEQAQKIVEQNGYAARAKVWPKRSQDLVIGRELPERAEVLVTEIFSSGIINEGLLPTLEHAHEHLLIPGAVVVPKTCSAMGYLVGGELLKEYLFMGQVNGFDMSLFNEFAAFEKQIQLDRHPHDVLSDDVELIQFDLSGQKTFTARRETLLKVEVTRSGICVGVGQWIRLQLDDVTRYENRPNLEAPRPSAWMHVVYRFQKPRRVSPGDVLTLLVRCTRTQIGVELAEEALPF